MPRTTNNHKAERKQVADLNAAKRADRTDEEQLALLIDRGHGHCAEALALRPDAPDGYEWAADA